MTTPPQPAPHIPFPDPRAVVAEDAARYRALSPRDRWRRLFALRVLGTRQRRDRPATGRESAAEDRWRQIQEELFSRHAQRA